MLDRILDQGLQDEAGDERVTKIRRYLERNAHPVRKAFLLNHEILCFQRKLLG